MRDNILKAHQDRGDGRFHLRSARSDRARLRNQEGKKSETTRKFFPGYLIVNMHLLDENNQLVGRTWYFIRETPA